MSVSLQELSAQYLESAQLLSERIEELREAVRLRRGDDRLLAGRPITASRTFNFWIRCLRITSSAAPRNRTFLLYTSPGVMRIRVTPYLSVKALVQEQL